MTAQGKRGLLGRSGPKNTIYTRGVRRGFLSTGYANSLVLGGDSRMSLNGPAAPGVVYNTISSILGNSWLVTDTAVNSRGWLDNTNDGFTTGIISQLETEVKPLFDPSKNNFYLVWCWINDYPFNNNVNAIYGMAYTGIRTVQSYGYTVLFSTEIDDQNANVNTPPLDWHATDRAISDTLINANTLGTDQVLDLYTNVPSTQDASNLTYFNADETHPNALGSTLIGMYFGTSVQVATLVPHSGSVVTWRDDCVDSNGTALTVHVPSDSGNSTGTPWVAGVGTFTIQNNKITAQTMGGGGNATAYFQTGSSDGTWAGTLNAGTGNGVGLIFRYQDDDNYWFGDISVGTQTILIFEKLSGSFNVRTSISTTLLSNTDYQVSYSGSGNNMSFTVVGHTINFSSSSGASRKLHGIYADNTDGQSQTYKNMTFTTL